MRFITSFNFLLVLGLFFLPWIDVRCESGGQKISLLHQSGFQAATGEFTEGELLQKKRAEEKNKGLKAVNDANDMKLFPKDGESLHGASLMFIYLGVICAGVVLSLVLPRGNTWRGGILLCVIIAVVCLGTQTAIGFPVEKKFQNPLPERAPEGKVKDDEAAAKEMMKAMLPKTALLFPYYLSWLFVLSCAFCVFMESILNSKTTKKYTNRTLDDDDPTTDDNPFE